MHAIGGRTVDVEEAALRPAHGEWPVEGERIGGTAAVALRRDHRNLRQRREHFGQQRDARREVAVIVAQQDAHDSVTGDP